jgi:hypothetical protein
LDITSWTAVGAIAAVGAAVGTVGALFAALRQLRDARADRLDDYYRQHTPFLSFEVPKLVGHPTPAIDVHADGGGFAFNVLANIDQTNATTGKQMTLTGQQVIRYLREGPPDRIAFTPQASVGFQGLLRVTFLDTFGINHEAQQAVKFGAGDQLVTTNAVRWVCGPKCRVHVARS